MYPALHILRGIYIYTYMEKFCVCGRVSAGKYERGGQYRHLSNTLLCPPSDNKYIFFFCAYLMLRVDSGEIFFVNDFI